MGEYSSRHSLDLLQRFGPIVGVVGTVPVRHATNGSEQVVNCTGTVPTYLHRTHPMTTAGLLLLALLPLTILGQDRITGRAFATRSEVIARHGMAATSQPLATQVALAILKRGGHVLREGVTQKVGYVREGVQITGQACQ